MFKKFRKIAGVVMAMSLLLTPFSTYSSTAAEVAINKGSRISTRVEVLDETFYLGLGESTTFIFDVEMDSADMIHLVLLEFPEISGKLRYTIIDSEGIFFQSNDHEDNSGTRQTFSGTGTETYKIIVRNTGTTALNAHIKILYAY